MCRRCDARLERREKLLLRWMEATSADFETSLRRQLRHETRLELDLPVYGLLAPPSISLPQRPSPARPRRSR